MRILLGVLAVILLIAMLGSKDSDQSNFTNAFITTVLGIVILSIL